MVEQFLSKGPSVPVIRRHAKSDAEMHFGPALRVVGGNWVAAKRRGILEGTDFGYTGEVRFVIADAIKRQLEVDNIVLLSNVGFAAGGEVLNCNTYDVGLHAAVELEADKLCVLHLDDVKGLGLPPWLPLPAAKALLLARLRAADPDGAAASDASISGRPPARASGPASPLPRYAPPPGAAPPPRPPVGEAASDALVVDLDLWQAHGFPLGVSACVAAASRGVKRAHLLDARIDGGLLLELYSRDGVGTMISADFYEGIRPARPDDVGGIEALLRPLEAAGVLVHRSREDIANAIQHFTVVERETKVLGCALVLPLGATADGVAVAEVAAFCIDAAFRGSGRGDSLLDYCEQDARGRGVRRLVLLTTRTADWFQQRDFALGGPAARSELLPPDRRGRINPARNSQLYYKDLEAPDETLPTPGKRIGF